MDYIDRITSLREDNDYKQKDIAEILGIKQSAYSKYEKRRTKIQVEDLIKLCKLYNVSADYILGFTDEQKPLSEK
jgi:transcriptional regulator with XRE-family HTH domain